MPPTTLTQPDFGVRTHTAYHLEKKLCAFIQQLFTNTYQLDNPAVNLQQTAFDEMHDLPQVPKVAPLIYTPSVSYDPTQRAQTLQGKVPPQVVRGRVPRTVTGEIDPSKLPDFPSISVQVVHGHVEKLETHVGVQIYFHAYDEDPNSHGYQDLVNMIEVVALALTSYGQKGIDDAYVIVLPLDWKVPENTLFPHYIGEMTTTWQLPSARPLPDDEPFWTNPVGVEGLKNIPAEHIDLEVSESTENNLWPPTE
jgi:hypothetical protein